MPVDLGVKKFQSTRPRGARQITKFSVDDHNRFNPRARGGRDLIRPGGYGRMRCFNPRARGGRDPHITEMALVEQVSIHAPAGGAT